MKISEIHKTQHELICILYKTVDDKTLEKWIDIHKTDGGELLNVSIGSKEFDLFELEILTFLKKKGKL